MIKVLRMDEKMREQLLSLKKGECLATGRFVIGSATIERPVKMTF